MYFDDFFIMLVSDLSEVHARTCIRIKYKYEIRL